MKFPGFALAIFLPMIVSSSPCFASIPETFLSAMRTTDAGHELITVIGRFLNLSNPSLLHPRLLSATLREHAELRLVSDHLMDISTDAFTTLRREGRLSRFPYEPPVSRANLEAYSLQTLQIADQMDDFYRTMNMSERLELIDFLRDPLSGLDDVVRSVPVRAGVNFLTQ